MVVVVDAQRLDVLVDRLVPRSSVVQEARPACASPSGGNSEYLIGRKNGLVASVSAGRIIFTFMRTSTAFAGAPAAKE